MFVTDLNLTEIQIKNLDLIEIRVVCENLNLIEIVYLNS